MDSLVNEGAVSVHLPPRLRVRWSLLWCLGAPALAAAQVAGDPTLPPASLLAPGAGTPAPSASAQPELQSILVSREAGGRRVAVISGEMVRQGSRYHGAVVESVGETAVVLRRGKARETLRLFQGRPAPAPAQPAVTKKEIQ